MSTIKVRMVPYSFTLDSADEREQYNQLRGKLEGEGRECWDAYSPQVSQKYRHSIGHKDLHIETDHMFEDQWNTAEGVRVYDWFEIIFPNSRFKKGYYLTDTDELHAALESHSRCGYCGNQEPASDKKFCDKCLGRPYLKVADLHLLRMVPIWTDGKRTLGHRDRRQELTEEESNELVPLYVEEQIKGTEERNAARLEKMKERLERELANAHLKYNGIKSLIEMKIDVENVIFYDHRQEFNFGWRTPLSPVVAEQLRKDLKDWPFKYTMEVK